MGQDNGGTSEDRGWRGKIGREATGRNWREIKRQNFCFIGETTRSCLLSEKWHHPTQYHLNHLMLSSFEAFFIFSVRGRFNGWHMNLCSEPISDTNWILAIVTSELTTSITYSLTKFLEYLRTVEWTWLRGCATHTHFVLLAFNLVNQLSFHAVCKGGAWVYLKSPERCNVTT